MGPAGPSSNVIITVVFIHCYKVACRLPLYLRVAWVDLDTLESRDCLTILALSLQLFRTTNSTQPRLDADPDCLEATMFSRQILCVSLFAAAVADSSGGSSASLRGSVAAPRSVAVEASLSTSVEQLQHLHCSCDEAGPCACITNTIGTSGQAEEDAELQQAMLNTTQELRAWREVDEHIDDKRSL